MNFKKWVKSVQTAGYNGARTVHGFVYKLMIYFFRLSSRSKAALTARFAPKFAHKGGSQLIDLIIVELKNHMTC